MHQKLENLTKLVSCRQEPVTSTRMEEAEQRRHVGFQDTFTCHYGEMPTRIETRSSSPQRRASEQIPRSRGSNAEGPRQVPRPNAYESTASCPNCSSWQGSRLSHSPRDVESIVRKWQVRFSGERNQSIEVFLTRVEDYRASANLSDEQMLAALAELLTDTAATWYQNEKHKWQCWGDFVVAAKRWYGTNQRFHQRLIAEANSRTQGEDEAVREYIPCLIGIMRKQQPIPSISAQLDLLHRNMLPRLQRQVKRTDCTSIETLLEMAVEAELTEEGEKMYRPPPAPETTLLPEMAYKKKKPALTESSKPKAVVAAVSTEQTNREADMLSKIGQMLQKLLQQNNGSQKAAKQEGKKPGNNQYGKRKADKSEGKKDKEESEKSPKERRRLDLSKQLTCDGCGKPGWIKRYCPDCSGNENKGG